MNRLLFLCLLMLPVSIQAHEIRPGLLVIFQEDESNYTAEFKQPQVQGRFLNLRFSTNCQQTLQDAVVGSAALQETFSLKCNEPLSFIEISGLEGTLVDTMVTIASLTGDKKSFLVTSRNPRIDTASGTAVPAYFVLGIEHLAFGLDHVLFVLLLLFIVKGWKNLLKVVTSFTVAHSITLALSAYEVISLPQSPIEALIALSIILLAAEALQPGRSLIHERPWLVTFMFGLLHGLGFAGALMEIGLPQSSTVSALLLFNVGIEVGQVLIVLAALGLLFIASRLGLKFSHPVFLLPVYFIGGLATYWFIERSLGIFV